MKKITLTLVTATALSFGAMATVITVSNNPNSPGQYSDLQLACDAANDYDTIYVHGSPTPYGGVGVNIEKPLVLIGAGAYPNKSFNYSSMVNKITFKPNIYLTNSGSNSVVKGFQIGSFDIGYAQGSIISDITMERNRIGFGQSMSIGGGAPYNNLYFHNNIVNIEINFGTGTGIINNNIFSENVLTLDINGNAYAFYNNLFFKGIEPHHATVANNIFLGSLNSNENFIYLQSSYSVISNNSFLNGVGFPLTNGDIIFGTNSGTGNIINQNPQFVDDNNRDFTQLMAATYDYNFHTSPQSPCNNAGTDGTDIGIYGGASPWYDGDIYSVDGLYHRYYPMPDFPTVLEMHVNSSVLPNGTLNVQFKARKQN